MSYPIQTAMEQLTERIVLLLRERRSEYGRDYPTTFTHDDLRDATEALAALAAIRSCLP